MISAARAMQWAIAMVAACLVRADVVFTAPAAQRDAVPDSVYVRQHYLKRILRIPMRDGAQLFTVAYVPRDAAPARRYPIILERTPFSVAHYGEDAYPATLGPDPFMLRDGYIFVVQEVRGRYMSGGTFENVRPLLDDAARARDPRATDEVTDAHDTIDWLLAHVDGNNGRVGLLGISYGGFYAAAAAVSHHPAIAAMSLQAPVTDFYFEDFHHNGALVQGSFYAYPVFGVTRRAPTATHWWLPAYARVAEHGMEADYRYQLALGPLANITQRFYGDNTLWRDVIAHPNYDAFWQARALLPHLRGIAHPVLVVGGWFDAENLYGALGTYRTLRAQSPAAQLTLVMGPWGHRDWGARDVVHSVHGDLYFGDSLETRFQREVEAPFFRTHLKSGNHDDALPGSLLFDTGRKQWVAAKDWPLGSAVRRSFYFHRDGSLRTSAPTEPSAFVPYTSDPRKPVPTRCAGATIEDGRLYHYMSDDQRCFSSRPDVVTFATDTLERDVTFSGSITARIALSTTGSDADVVVKLVDVYPPNEPNHPFQRDDTLHLAGYQQLVRGEIMRARFRRSFTTPEPLRSGEVTEVAFTLPDVMHTFRKGHRIMVQVQGSWFPLFDRNPQRYVPNLYTASARDFVSAQQRIWVSASAASRIEADILP
ncbi:MAG: CocE/NonD family hydrolase [Gemmatimonadaceae bacterium]